MTVGHCRAFFTAGWFAGLSMLTLPSAPAGPGGRIEPCPVSVNSGGTPSTDVTAMWSVKKCVSVRPTVSALLTVRLVPGDVNDPGRRSGR